MTHPSRCGIIVGDGGAEITDGTARHPSFSTVLHWTDRQCRAYLEQIRWPEGPVCPWCGGVEPYRIVRRSRTKNKVASFYKCRACRRQFSVTVGTIFEGSKIPLRKWFAAVYPMCAFKRGIGAQQIQVQAKVTYKTAWLMCQRIRDAIGGEDALLIQEAGEEADGGVDG